MCMTANKTQKIPFTGHIGNPQERFTICVQEVDSRKQKTFCGSFYLLASWIFGIRNK